MESLQKTGYPEGKLSNWKNDSLRFSFSSKQPNLVTEWGKTQRAGEWDKK